MGRATSPSVTARRARAFALCKRARLSSTRGAIPVTIARHAVGVGMQPVGEHKRLVAGDAGKEERIERQPVALRKLGKIASNRAL